MTHLVTEKLILRQINHWNRYRDILAHEQDDETPPPGPVITISRIAGCGGSDFAKLLAKRLDLEFHDHSLVEKIAREQNLPDKIVDQLDEKSVSSANLWVQGVLKQRFFMVSEYRAALTKTILDLADQGNALFLGRGANLILGQNATLRIRVVAPLPYRLEHLRQKTGVGKAETRAYLQTLDNQREEFIRKVFRTEPGQPENFDLILNADRLSTDGMLDLAMMALLDRKTHGIENLKKMSAQK